MKTKVINNFVESMRENLKLSASEIYRGITRETEIEKMITLLRAAAETSPGRKMWVGFRVTTPIGNGWHPYWINDVTEVIDPEIARILFCDERLTILSWDAPICNKDWDIRESPVNPGDIHSYDDRFYHPIGDGVVQKAYKQKDTPTAPNTLWVYYRDLYDSNGNHWVDKASEEAKRLYL